MAKPTIVTRAGKGSALTWTEGDSNLTNLRDATITVAGDSGSIVNDLNGSFTIAGGTGLTSSATSTTLTLNLDNTAVTAGSYTLSSITVDAQGRITAASSGSVTYPTITDDTATNATRYIVFDDATSGNLSTVGTSSTKLTFNPSTGVLSPTAVSTGNITSTARTAIKDLTETVYSLGTTSGTIAPNVANGTVQSITLNGNLTLNAFTSPVAGQSLTLIVNTNGTSRTLSSTMKFAGASKTLSTTSTTDIISVFYDGTNYWASLSKGFA